ncbi:MAG: hypothetical protein PVH79_01165 [Candidatus Bathyarchaeota archaeon]|jgi:hypothetical protein
MIIELSDPLKKYVKLTQDRQMVDRFICPVEGCNFTTKLGPGALRMHLLLKADPDKESRYCKAHGEFCDDHRSELSLDIVRYLHNLPMVPMET